MTAGILRALAWVIVGTVVFVAAEIWARRRYTKRMNDMKSTLNARRG